MATVADELLNDFEDSGSENDEAPNEDLFAGDDVSTGGDGVSAGQQQGQQREADMELDEDEEAPQDGDADGAAPSHLKMDDGEDEEETKARVEKMELKAVSDVRSVAGLMKQLDPVIEVSSSRHHLCQTIIYILREQQT